MTKVYNVPAGISESSYLGGSCCSVANRIENFTDMAILEYWYSAERLRVIVSAKGGWAGMIEYVGTSRTFGTWTSYTTIPCPSA